LYVDPSLGADWFYVAARRYWQRFQPVVISSLDLLTLVPQGRLVAVTTLARRDFAKKLADDIRKRFPTMIHDPLVYDSPAELQLTLDGRVDYYQRFGLFNDAMPTPPVTPVPATITPSPSPTPKGH
jgi:hypothetical protein